MKQVAAAGQADRVEVVEGDALTADLARVTALFVSAAPSEPQHVSVFGFSATFRVKSQQLRSFDYMCKQRGTPNGSTTKRRRKETHELSELWERTRRIGKLGKARTENLQKWNSDYGLPTAFSHKRETQYF